MVVLDYRTNNFAHGLSGIVYSSWENYAFSLGYLSNAQNYRDLNPSSMIALRYEPNDSSGAVGKEGRIQYYGDINFLKYNFPDWYYCRSAGNGNMTCRINSNDFVFNSLVYDYSFKYYIDSGEKTVKVIPPDDPNAVLNVLVKNLPSNVNKKKIIDSFYDGFRT